MVSRHPFGQDCATSLRKRARVVTITTITRCAGTSLVRLTAQGATSNGGIQQASDAGTLRTRGTCRSAVTG